MIIVDSLRRALKESSQVYRYQRAYQDSILSQMWPFIPKVSDHLNRKTHIEKLKLLNRGISGDRIERARQRAITNLSRDAKQVLHGNEDAAYRLSFPSMLRRNGIRYEIDKK